MFTYDLEEKSSKLHPASKVVAVRHLIGCCHVILDALRNLVNASLVVEYRTLNILTETFQAGQHSVLGSLQLPCPDCRTV